MEGFAEHYGCDPLVKERWPTSASLSDSDIAGDSMLLDMVKITIDLVGETDIGRLAVCREALGSHLSKFQCICRVWF